MYYIAGVGAKNVNAGLTKVETEAGMQREKYRSSDLSISAFETGLKKQKGKKNKKAKAEEEEVGSDYSDSAAATIRGFG